ncbi:MAG: hypothetical protein WAS54_06055 [Scrofimicrobium sp.]
MARQNQQAQNPDVPPQGIQGNTHPQAPNGNYPVNPNNTLPNAPGTPGPVAKQTKPWYKKWWIWAIAAVVLIGVIASLGGGGDDSSTNTGATTPAAVEESTEESATTEEEEVTEEPANTNPTFGDTYTWDDGLAVTISQPTEFTPSEYSAGAVEGQTALSYEVTLTNGTDKDVESVMIMLTVASGGSEGSAIFDSNNGVEIPTSTILPGKSLTWTVAYSVADPADVQISVDNVIDFSAPKVHFTN